MGQDIVLGGIDADIITANDTEDFAANRPDANNIIIGDTDALPPKSFGSLDPDQGVGPWTRTPAAPPDAGPVAPQPPAPPPYAPPGPPPPPRPDYSFNAAFSK